MVKEILGCLAESGADLFSPNEAGESALRIAIKRGSFACPSRDVY